MQSIFKTILFSLLLFPWHNIAQKSEAKALPHYDLEVNILPEQRMLEATLNLYIDSDLVQEGQLELLLNRDAQIEHIKADPPAEIEIEELDQARNKIILNLPGIREDQVAVRITHTLEIPKNHQVNRITEEWVELNIDSFWMPLISGFPRFNYEMKLSIDPSFTVMTGDIKEEIQQDRHMIVSRLPRLNISFSAAREFYSVEGDLVKVSAVNPNTKIDSVKMIADRAMTFLNEYIEEPKDFNFKRKVIISPREEVGYSRKNYVVLSDIKNESALSLAGFLCHEFAHYWFSEAVLSSKHHWLTESFAEYLSMIFIREKYGQGEFERDIEEKIKRIEGDKKALADYDGRPSHLAMYFKGPLILYQFEQYIGEENFRLLINGFVDRSISTNEELYHLVDSLFGKEAVLKLKKLRAEV